MYTQHPFLVLVGAIAILAIIIGLAAYELTRKSPFDEIDYF